MGVAVLLWWRDLPCDDGRYTKQLDCCKYYICGFDSVRKRCMAFAKVSEGSNACGANPQIPKAELRSLEATAPTPATLTALSGMLEVGSKESGSSSYVTGSEIAESKPYPGVDYLGVGYDFSKGNPSGDPKFMLDPGFRQPIRRMKYSMQWATRDGKYRVPQGAYAMPMYSCHRSDQYENIADFNSYQKANSKDTTFESSGSVSVSGGFGGVSAQAEAHFAHTNSESSKEAHNQAREMESYKFESRSYCNKYFFRWLHTVPEAADLTPPFIRSVCVRMSGRRSRLAHCLCLRRAARSPAPMAGAFPCHARMGAGNVRGACVC